MSFKQSFVINGMNIVMEVILPWWVTHLTLKENVQFFHVK
jgi:hypothetical protein